MADQVVTLRISANADGTIRAVRQLSGELDRMGVDGAAGGAAAARGLKQVETEGRQAGAALDGLVEGAKELALAFVSIQGVSSLARIADEYTNLSSKIRLVTDSEAELKAVREAVFKVAQTTRQDLTATADLYTRLARATADMGLSQQELLGITTTINQAFVVSGATAQESAAAIVQLSQGLASGVLRGEEFNSVAEQAPIIMELLTKHLGVTRGELRKMAEEGQLTSDVLVNALGESAASVADQFDQMSLTISGSFMQLKNAFTLFIGQADEANGASSVIAATVSGVAANFNAFANVVLAVAAVFGARFVAAQLHAAASLIGTQLAARAVAVEMGIMTGASTAATASMTALRGALALLGGPIGIALLGVTALAVGIYKLVQAEKQRRAEFEAGLEATLAASDATADLVARMQEASEVPPPALAVSMNQQTEATKVLIEQQEALRAKRAEIASLEAQIERQLSSSRESSGLALLAIFPRLEEAKQRYAELSSEVRVLEGSLGDLADQINARFAPAIDAASKAGERFGRSLDNWDFNGAIGALEDLGAAFVSLGAIEEADKAAAAFTGDLQKRLKEAREEMGRAGKSAETLAQEWIATGVASAEAAGRTREQVAALREQGAELVRLIRQTEQLERSDANASKTARERQAADRRALQTRREMREEAEQHGRSLLIAEEATQKYIEALRIEVGDIGKTREELRRLTVLRALENRLIAERAEPEVAAKRRAEVEDLLAKGAALEEVVRQQDDLARTAKEAASEYERTWVQASHAVAYAFGDFVSGSIDSFRELGQALKQIARRMVADLVATFLRQRIIVPIQMAMAGGGGGVAGAAGQLMRGGGGGLGSIFGQLSPGALFGNAAFSAGTSLFGLGGTLGAFGGGMATAGANMLGSGFFGSMGANIAGGFGALGGGGIAAGLGQLLPVVGQIAAIAGLVNSIAGGRLFGTRAAPDSAARQIEIGAGGAGGFESTTSVRQRSLFRGREWRETRSDLGDEVQQQIEQLFDAVGVGMSAAARALGVEVPEIIAGSFRQEFDRDGKLRREFSTIAGRVYDESQEAFGQRLLAENILATVGTRDGDASAIAERWRADAAELLEGSQFLLAAATDIRNGTALLSEGGLGAVTTLIEELATDSESLTGAYARVRAGTLLLEEALALSGLTLDRSREDFVRFAAGIAEAAGGLERAQSLWSTYFSTFYSASERADQALARAREGAGQQFADIGLDASAFDGDAGVVAFRQMFERVLPSLSADAVVEWLEAAEALSVVLAAQQSYTDALAEAGLEAERAAEALRATFEALIASITEVRGRVSDDIQGLRSNAPGFDAVGFQRERISSLSGQLSGATPQQQVGLIDQIRQATLNRFNAESEQVRALAAAQAEATQVEQRRRDEAIRAAEQAHAEAMRGWEAQIQAAARLRDFVHNLGLSSVSPLTATERFDEAQSLYQRALAGGDAGALQQAAQAFLEETRNVYGVSDRAVGIFNEVRGALGARANQLAGAAAPVFHAPILEAAATGTTTAVVNVESAIEALRAQTIADLQGLDDLLAALQVQTEAQFNSELEALNAQFTQAGHHNAVLVETLGLIDTDQATRDAQHLAVLRDQLAATQALVDQQAASNVVMLQRVDAQSAEQREILAAMHRDNERMARAIDQVVRAEVRR